MPTKYAVAVRNKRDKWHLDEVFVTINEQQYYLWRAVDSQSNVLNILMQNRKDTQAAKKFFRKLLKKHGFAPRVIVTDKLKSYAAAKKEILQGVKHRQHKGLNNRAENSHQPTRLRERRMRKFKSPVSCTTISLICANSFEVISTQNNINSLLLNIDKKCATRVESWRELTGIETAA